MKAELVNFTPNPIDTIYDLYWHDKFGEDRADVPEKEKWAFVLQLLKEDWCGLLEFASFTWKFVVPRALHAQIRVHRHWSFWSQSHQLHEPKSFAEDGEYFSIPNLREEERPIEKEAMRDAQDKYNLLIQRGVLPSLARGVLPQHINLGLSVNCNLRSLFKVVVERRCHILQGTYWNPLLEMMKEEMVTKVNPLFGEIFNLQPCDVRGSCLSTIEQELRVSGADPHIVCPRYRSFKETGSFCCGQACLGCTKGGSVVREIRRSKQNEAQCNR